MGLRVGYNTKTRKVPANENTPRGIVSYLFSIFDVVGLIGPILFKGKLLTHKAWCDVREWDKEVDCNLAQTFNIWAKDMVRITHEFRVPRWLGTQAGQDVQLHVFSDASESGFGAAAYVRFEKANNGRSSGGEDLKGGYQKIDNPNFGSALLASKNRLAPQRKISLPRLELQGVVTASRLTEALLPELDKVLKVTRIFLWSDSTIVCAWVRSESGKFATFVANRVAEIQENTVRHADVPCQLRHVKGIQNPSDLLTRGLGAQEFLDSKDFWLNGPEWLRQTEDHWPAEVVFELDPGNPATREELRPAVRPNEDEATALLSVSQEQSFRSYLAEKFSSWEKLRGVLAILLAFKRRVWARVRARRAGQPVPLDTEPGLQVTAEEYKEAEELLFLDAQHSYFHKEILALRASPEGKVFKGGPFNGLRVKLDGSGVIRMLGRLPQPKHPFSREEPVVIPGRSRLGELLIDHAHRQCGHMSSEWVLANLRKQYFLTPGMSCIKRVVRRCIGCRLLNPKPVVAPPAPFHPNRLDDASYPFARCGVDHFGHFWVHPRRDSRQWEKRWILTFFCLTTRAVHMEVCERPDVESFLAAFERFVSLRNKPVDVYCDAGTTNVGSSKEIRRLFAKHAVTIRHRMFEKGVEFHFNPTATPHWGGSYERAIRTARKCMKPAISAVRNLTQEILITIVASCTRIINERPIAWGSDGLPVTPQEALSPFSRDRRLTPVSSDFRYFKKVQQAEIAFWAKWRSLYLSQLSVKTAWRSGENVDVKIGDVVLVKGRSANWFWVDWVLARVDQTWPNPVDGRTRYLRVWVPREKKSFDITIEQVSLLESAGKSG